MADIVVSDLERIIKVALAIKKAVETAKQNKEDCVKIGERAAEVSTHMKRLQENSEAMEDPSMSDTLKSMEETLERALKLVNECQRKHVVLRYFNASGMSKKLRQVQEDISHKLQNGVLAILIDTRIALGKQTQTAIDAPLHQHQQYAGQVETSRGNHSRTNQARSVQVNSEKGKTMVARVRREQSELLSGPGNLGVVIVYAFDCTDWTSAWYTVDDGVFWMVQEKLSHYMDSCMGYIYYMMDGNTYTSDMKFVDAAETRKTGYTPFARRRLACTKNMASGLDEAHKMISSCGYKNGNILLFSDGLIHRGDFFDGAENFVSEVPVHTFTLGGVEYNQGLHAIAKNSRGGKFHTIPVPERPMLSERFSKLLDSIFNGTTFQDENPPAGPSSENQPLDVVIVYAFDCTESTLAWYKVDGTIFWMVQEKLACLGNNSCLGYIYPMLTKNTYTSDMKIVDSADTKATGYTSFARRRIACTRNMASGLPEAHKMISNRGYWNGIILFFSDGLINKGDFFDGTEKFTSQFPVHTFTLGGDAYNHGLQAIADNSPGGTFNPAPVPDRPELSTTFSELLDSLLKSTKVD